VVRLQVHRGWMTERFDKHQERSLHARVERRVCVNCALCSNCRVDDPCFVSNDSSCDS